MYQVNNNTQYAFFNYKLSVNPKNHLVWQGRNEAVGHLPDNGLICQFCELKRHLKLTYSISKLMTTNHSNKFWSGTKRMYCMYVSWQGNSNVDIIIFVFYVTKHRQQQMESERPPSQSGVSHPPSTIMIMTRDSSLQNNIPSHYFCWLWLSLPLHPFSIILYLFMRKYCTK